MAEPEPVRPGWWHCRAIAADRTRAHYTLVDSDAYPDGTVVELSVDEAATAIGADAVCTAVYGLDGIVGELRLHPLAAPKAPPLWFAEIRESTAQPPADSLVAFSGHGVPAGALVDESGQTNVAVATADQLGAVRWYPKTGEVDQIYVDPAWRRRSIARGLIAAAGTLSLARDWAMFWTDGQRTELGELFCRTSPWRHRAAALTHVAPPIQ